MLRGSIIKNKDEIRAGVGRGRGGIMEIAAARCPQAHQLSYIEQPMRRFTEVIVSGVTGSFRSTVLSVYSLLNNFSWRNCGTEVTMVPRGSFGSQKSLLQKRPWFNRFHRFSCLLVKIIPYYQGTVEQRSHLIYLRGS